MLRINVTTKDGEPVSIKKTVNDVKTNIDQKREKRINAKNEERLAVLNAKADFYEKNGYFPTRREVAQILNHSAADSE